MIADTEVHEEKVAVSPEYDSHRFATSPSTSQSIGEQAMRNQVTDIVVAILNLY